MKNLFGASAALRDWEERNSPQGNGIQWEWHLIIQFSEPQTSWLCGIILLQIQQLLQHSLSLPIGQLLWEPWETQTDSSSL